jgi:predicted metal-dependent enzyme (double-stranded beta helix superfamily)
MFDLDEFIAQCGAAVTAGEPRPAIKEILERTMAGAGAGQVADVMQPREGGLNVLYSSEDLTILNVVWAPGMVLFPHDHLMWAAIGIYAGQEDNTFYRRRPDDPKTVTSSGGKELRAGDVMVLGREAIHGVTNPLDRITGAVHVYGGDFVNQPRSQWGPGPLEERPYDLDLIRAQFDEANTRARLPRQRS